MKRDVSFLKEGGGSATLNVAFSKIIHGGF